jgi:DNA-binding CsgD family transcriptional regulator
LDQPHTLEHFLRLQWHMRPANRAFIAAGRTTRNVVAGTAIKWSEDVHFDRGRTTIKTPLAAVAMPQAPPVELVQSLFDLTPAEARVARSLASGKTVNDIATDGGVLRNTILTQLRGVLEKTGCNRQADVVALLTTISPAR